MKAAMKLLATLGVVIAMAAVTAVLRAEDPGSLAGTVSLAGAPPRNLPISLDADPNCAPAGGRKARKAPKVLQQEVVVGKGGGRPQQGSE